MAAMRRDFEIINGIYLSQPPHVLDLHNDFDFHDLRYSIRDRILSLHWRRSNRKSVPANTPASVCVAFREVSEFRFHPRDPKQPFTEDDCMNTFGFWTDEDWADGVIVPDRNQTPEPSWLTAVDFMSGAIILVQTASAHARIES
jgi:hypothetical protein